MQQEIEIIARLRGTAAAELSAAELHDQVSAELGRLADADSSSRVELAAFKIEAIREEAEIYETDGATDADESVATTALRHASGAISALLEQIEQMAAMFDDDDVALAQAVESGERAEAEIEAALARLALLDAAPDPVRVVVALEGGTVQGASFDREGIELTVLDYDTEGADPERVFAVPQGNGTFADAYRFGFGGEVNPAFIDGVEGARLADAAHALETIRTRLDSADWCARYPDEAEEDRQLLATIQRDYAEELATNSPTVAAELLTA